MKNTVMLIATILAYFFSYAQENKRNDTTIKVIKNYSDAVPDELVKPDLRESNVHSAIPFKSKEALSNEVSLLMKKKDSFKYKSLVGESLLYLVKFNKGGAVTSVVLQRSYLYSSVFNGTLTTYIRRLKFYPGYVIKKGKKINISTARLLQIKVL